MSSGWSPGCAASERHDRSDAAGSTIRASLRRETWFETIQGRIIEAMEALEREFAAAGPVREPGRFALEPWGRTDASGAPGGGGRMAMLRGRLFEKMGAHSSVVYGAFPSEFAAQIPAPKMTRASGPPAYPSSLIPGARMCRRST